MKERLLKQKELNVSSSYDFIKSLMRAGIIQKAPALG